LAESFSPIFRVRDAGASLAWYERLRFEEVSRHTFAPGLPVYLIVRRGEVYLHLSEHTGDAHPFGLAYLWVEDVDAVAAEFGVTVEDNPWARDLELTDPDGNRVRVGQPNATP
jgi:catechol 2,3-dioxygenase-like lactoylglutathione lyase family enzyme